MKKTLSQLTPCEKALAGAGAGMNPHLKNRANASIVNACHTRGPYREVAYAAISPRNPVPESEPIGAVHRMLYLLPCSP